MKNFIKNCKKKLTKVSIGGFTSFFVSIFVFISVFMPISISNSTFNINTVSAQGKYESELTKSVEKIEGKLDSATINPNQTGAQNVNNFIIDKLIKIAMPLAIIVGIIFAILGFYRVIFSEDTETTKIGLKYILYGVIGILIMMSARYMTDILTREILFNGGTQFSFDPAVVSERIYTKIVYPFMKMAFYLVLGSLFILLVIQVFKYLFSTGDSIKKNITTMLTWNFISLFIIIGSKQIIEAVYGKKAEILRKGASTLGDIGEAILTTKELPIVYTIINWIMSLTALIVLIIIIYQSYLLLTQPDSEEQFKRVKKSILYIFIGIIIIGAGYLITNFLIIN